ncbi:hypothetical protein Scep_013025 [Stephania cephalantha]|uniref:Nucleolar pre-ribosomal-associated protein 1 n=1 Tax=Stephania cephalantha TaxID=152367 RepID=A0AAP0JGM5_9MAGN
MSFDAKLKQVLHNLCLDEIKIYSEASKEFIGILRDRDIGDQFLRQYVQSSPLCSELVEAWQKRKGKPGLVHILSLISVILDHPNGKYCSGDRERMNISRRLDKFARSIIETKLEDVYMELNSKESKCQNAVLSLLAAVVRRGVGLATELAKKFDFKNVERKGRHSTRRSFIEFAMSFLEVGNPRLLRWVLQQKNMYSGVLCGLGSDDDDTVVYVLSVIRDRVLNPDSLVPPSLRSVLFGSVTLDQLASISGNPLGGPPAQIAHEVLVMVCTDPCNGLMPDLSDQATMLKGNRRRLLELMKKLKATEIDNHRHLLLNIVSGRPAFGSAYMEDFPYLLEPRASSTWITAISLASDLVAHTRTQPFVSVDSQFDDPPSLDSSEVQCLLKCLLPNSFARIVINRGLLHSDSIVKHGTMRLLLEALKSLYGLVRAIDCKSSSNDRTTKKWISLKQEIQDGVRALLPDPQVLLQLLSSPSSLDSKNDETSRKRPRKPEKLAEIHDSNGLKKLKVDEDVDILIGGIGTELDADLPKEKVKATGTVVMEELAGDDCTKATVKIWGLQQCSFKDELKDAQVFFRSKLLDALTLYIRAIPKAMDRSYDFFKLLPANPSAISVNEQQSLLSLLMEYVGLSSENRAFVKPPEAMFKHLQSLIYLSYSPIKGIRDKAYELVRAAMLSTGGFDRKPLEIDAWIMFLPGHERDASSVEDQCVEALRYCSTIVSFLCDAISTLGNNIFKYLNELRCLCSSLEGMEDDSPDFSPLVPCILRKCIRLVDSGSRTFKLYEKSLISTYVCNTLCFILQTQVEGRLLSRVIDSILIERFGNSSSVNLDEGEFFCEWRPLKNLLFFSQNVSHHQDCSGLFTIVPSASAANGVSFARMLHKAKKMVGKVGNDDLVRVASAFRFSTICTSPAEIVENFPCFITLSKHLFREDLSFLSFMFFLERKLLASVANMWPDMFRSGLEWALSVDPNCKESPRFLHESVAALKEQVSCVDVSEVEAASLAFSSFLKEAPFHILFPAVILSSSSSSSSLHLLHSAKMLDLLRAKLSRCSANKSVALVQLMLFWFHQIQLSYRFQPLGELKQLSEICFLLLKYMVSELLFGKFDYEGPKRACVLEVVETICNSPALTLTLSHPSCCHEEPSPGSLNISFEEFCGLSEAGIHPMDNIVLLLETVAKNILVLSHGDNSVHETDEAANKRIVNVFKDIIKQVVLTFKCKLEICISTEDLIPLLPIFTIFKAFIYFMSPSMLLELVNWIFSKVEEKDLNDLESLRTFGFSLGCYVCEVALESLYANLNKQSPKAVAFDLYWEMEGRTNDISHLEKVCYKIIEIATSFKLENADLCLLKVVNIVNKQRIIQPRIAILPSCMALVKVILSSPIEMISHCINNTSATRAKLLFFLTQSSSLHLTLFGKILTSILNGDKKQTREICKCAPTDEELIILLPVTLLFLDMCFERFGLDFLKHFGSVLSSYSNILLDSFLNWRSFAAGNIFQEDAGEFLPSSTHELLKGFSESLLGKAVCMLQYHFTIDNDSAMIRTRRKLFDHICSYSNKNRGLLDFDMCEIKLCSPEDSLKLINRVIAKISFCWMLLFPKEDLLHSLHTVTEGQSRKLLQGLSVENERSAKMGFINLLVTTLHHIVQGFPLVADDSEKQKNADCSQIFRCLEIFILGIIMEFAKQMRDDLIQLSSIPFLENFVKTCFLFRFEDPTTLRVLRSVLNLLSEGKFRHNMFFEMLLEHSQFVPTIHSLDSSFASLALPIASTLLKPMSSILKSFDLFSAEISNDSDIIARDTCSLYMRKLELVRLLRTLYHLRVSSLSSEENTHVNSRELISLLFSCYGATMCEIDMEIFNLIRDIMSNEGSDCVSIADMDYLWGSSASKVRSEKTLDKALSSNDMADCETAEDRRRGQFRDYFAFDCKLCVATILNFPYDRTTSNDGIFLKKILQENLIDKPEIPAGSCGIQRYDPAFLLHMSIHVLSNGYLEPLEFAGLGLLAVAFMSMSSPDKGMRKLGYEAIGRFKNSLETCQNRKDGLRLRLLLTCLQNGITEPWQRIPSVVAIFSAEASFVLLDPSNDHYATISKLLMHSQQVNMKSMPLFNTMFESTSVNFKKERLWILQLSYAGLNLDVDAHIFMKGGLLEILMSFYYSPVADYESKILILQIMKKAVKLPFLANYLVEQCNLISWLSSILSFCGKKLHTCERNPFFMQIKAVLEVVNDVISSRTIIEWLQTYSLEQLSEFSSHVLKLFADNSKMIRHDVPLVISLLKVLVSTLRISQKRKLYQPHFTLSHEGLFQLCQAVDTDVRSSLGAELGLRAMLMSTPPAVLNYEGKALLLKSVTWGICTASRPYVRDQVFQIPTGSYCTSVSEEDQSQDSLISKLLRWVTASVILEKVLESFRTLFSPEITNARTLKALLENVDRRHMQSSVNDYAESRSNNEALASIILYLQQLLVVESRVLSSVVSALSLLLLSYAPSEDRDFIAELCSKIRSPVEINSAWRWSYYKPWEDLTSTQTELEKIEERHACQTLIVIFSNTLKGKSSELGLLPILTHQDLAKSGVFEWEKNFLIDGLSDA